jgi:hypothetical protein
LISLSFYRSDDIHDHELPWLLARWCCMAARALSWSGDGTLRLWDLVSLRQLACFVGDDPIICCVMTSDERLVLLDGLEQAAVLVAVADENVELPIAHRQLIHPSWGYAKCAQR